MITKASIRLVQPRGGVHPDRVLRYLGGEFTLPDAQVPRA
jgi:hypothetical protein